MYRASALDELAEIPESTKRNANVLSPLISFLEFKIGCVRFLEVHSYCLSVLLVSDYACIIRSAAMLLTNEPISNRPQRRSDLLAHSARKHNLFGPLIEHPGQGRVRGKGLFPADFRSTAAAVTAACAAVLVAAIGALAFAFTDFGKDDHVVSCADSILSASSLSWLAT